MIRHNGQSLTAVDVIRCVYLARLAQTRGDVASARRWQAKADAGLRESVPHNLSLTERKPPPS